MIFRLSTQDNKELLSVEVGLQNFIKREPFVEIRSEVNINNYSDYLMIIGEENKALFKESTHEIANLRTWMWEEYFARKRNTKESLDPIIKHVKNILMGAATQFDLKIDKP